MKKPAPTLKTKPSPGMKIRRIVDEQEFTVADVNSYRVVLDPGSKPITHRSFECDYEVVG
jgi:hypothetical protein